MTHPNLNRAQPCQSAMSFLWSPLETPPSLKGPEWDKHAWLRSKQKLCTKSPEKWHHSLLFSLPLLLPGAVGEVRAIRKLINLQSRRQETKMQSFLTSKTCLRDSTVNRDSFYPGELAAPTHVEISQINYDSLGAHSCFLCLVHPSPLLCHQSLCGFLSGLQRDICCWYWGEAGCYCLK